MVSWREEYMQALSERDEREKSTYQRITTDFIEACRYIIIVLQCSLILTFHRHRSS